MSSDAAGNGRKRVEAQVWALLAVALALLVQTLTGMVGVGPDNRTRESIAETSRQQVELLKAAILHLERNGEVLQGIERHNALIRETYGYGPEKIAEEVTRRLKEEK